MNQNSITYERLRKSAVNLIKDNFTLYEFAVQFNVDYKNLCAYVRGSKKMPLSLILFVLDYFDAKVVVFKRY